MSPTVPLAVLMSSQKPSSDWLSMLKAPAAGIVAFVNASAWPGPAKRTAPLLPTRATPAAKSELPIVVVMSTEPSSVRPSGVPVPEMSIQVPGRLLTIVSAGGGASVTTSAPAPCAATPPTRMK